MYLKEKILVQKKTCITKRDKIIQASALIRISLSAEFVSQNHIFLSSGTSYCSNINRIVVLQIQLIHFRTGPRLHGVARFIKTGRKCGSRGLTV